ncbi:hypothetical protein [Novosphingobium sp. BL-52-GroH]|uniref:hypothetical protein n=1 Tax=Novosphingobium sp. BL-52-GroH TaxID=3349877 RepID=UPI00384DFA1D
MRSEDQIRYQQFSTPLDLAGLVVLFAQVEPTDVELKPSAGNGSLVALPDVKSRCLNELDPKRCEARQVLFPTATIGLTVPTAVRDADRQHRLPRLRGSSKT